MTLANIFAGANRKTGSMDFNLGAWEWHQPSIFHWPSSAQVDKLFNAFQIDDAKALLRDGLCFPVRAAETQYIFIVRSNDRFNGPCKPETSLRLKGLICQLLMKVTSMDGVVDHRSSPSETATPTKQHPRSGARPSEALNSMSSPLWLHRVSGRSFHICWRYAIRQRTPQQAGRITSYGPGQPPTGDRTLWPEQVQDSNPRTRASVLSLLEERGYINSIAG